LERPDRNQKPGLVRDGRDQVKRPQRASSPPGTGPLSMSFFSSWPASLWSFPGRLGFRTSKPFHRFGEVEVLGHNIRRTEPTHMAKVIQRHFANPCAGVSAIMTSRREWSGSGGPRIDLVDVLFDTETADKRHKGSWRRKGRLLLIEA